MAKGLLAELLKVTGQKPKAKNETDADFRTRLAEAISSDDFAEEAYEGMSAEAKTWYATAAQCVNDKTPDKIPGFDEAGKEGEGGEEVETKEEKKAAPKASKAAKEKPAAKGKAKATKPEKPAKASAPKKEKVAKAPKEKAPPKEGPRETSASDLVKYIMAKAAPKILTRDQVEAVLKEKKVKMHPDLLKVEHMRTARVLGFLGQLNKLA